VSQFSLFQTGSKIFSVTELNQFVRNVIETEYRLQDIWVAGEISNLSIPSSGHMYFTLKDEAATLRCVMWRPEVARLLEIPKDGEAIEVHGKLGVYEAGGQYQLYADQIQVSGEGFLYQEFARLKVKLEGEGLFDSERKQPTPDFPERIGVVTSPTGAAFEDVLNVLRRRFPLAEIIISPTAVQGDEAPALIVAAIQALNDFSKPDLILIVRGGGSMEDLWAFNNEEVVRAVANSQIPVITGIGHETDMILADFAADLRAPTPSAAAEVGTPDRADLMDELTEIRFRTVRLMSDHILRYRWELRSEGERLLRTSPFAQINNAKQQIDELFLRIRTAVVHMLRLRRAAIEGLNQTLRVVGPSAILDRGFALVHRTEDGSLVRSVDDVEDGDGLRVRVGDGKFSAEVTDEPDSS
jgi:exodeoxyribonuclease VII large subunit